MSDIMPDPEFDTPDEFDLLMAENKIPILTPLATFFNEAEELLLATRPEGFDVEEIGELAFEELPEMAKAAAMKELFYTYWAARDQDRETLARHQAGSAR